MEVPRNATSASDKDALFLPRQLNLFRAQKEEQEEQEEEEEEEEESGEREEERSSSIANRKGGWTNVFDQHSSLFHSFIVPTSAQQQQALYEEFYNGKKTPSSSPRKEVPYPTNTSYSPSTQPTPKHRELPSNYFTFPLQQNEEFYNVAYENHREVSHSNTSANQPSQTSPSSNSNQGNYQGASSYFLPNVLRVPPNMQPHSQMLHQMPQHPYGAQHFYPPFPGNYPMMVPQRRAAGNYPMMLPPTMQPPQWAMMRPTPNESPPPTQKYPYSSLDQSSSNSNIDSHHSPKNDNYIMYRNLFHVMHCKLLHDGFNWESARVYIHESVGYAGNAKRFKRIPDKGEKALILECIILNPTDMKPIKETCLACRDYFDMQKYFKTNQECVGKIVLIKNNAPISIENGQFKINIKLMCCSSHHSFEYFIFQMTLTSTATQRQVYSAKMPIYVKQWRKSNQAKDDLTILLE